MPKLRLILVFEVVDVKYYKVLPSLSLVSVIVGKYIYKSNKNKQPRHISSPLIVFYTSNTIHNILFPHTQVQSCSLCLTQSVTRWLTPHTETPQRRRSNKEMRAWRLSGHQFKWRACECVCDGGREGERGGWGRVHKLGPGLERGGGKAEGTKVCRSRQTPASRGCSSSKKDRRREERRREAESRWEVELGWPSQCTRSTSCCGDWAWRRCWRRAWPPACAPACRRTWWAGCSFPGTSGSSCAGGSSSEPSSSPAEAPAGDETPRRET